MNHRLAMAHRRLTDHAERLQQRDFSDVALIHFAQAVQGAGVESLDCDMCQAALPKHIEAELNNRRDPLYRQIRQHVDPCQHCSEVYLDLLEVAILADRGDLFGPLLPMDLSFLGPPPERSSLDA